MALISILFFSSLSSSEDAKWSPAHLNRILLPELFLTLLPWASTTSNTFRAEILLQTRTRDLTSIAIVPLFSILRQCYHKSYTAKRKPNLSLLNSLYLSSAIINVHGMKSNLYCLVFVCRREFGNSASKLDSRLKLLLVLRLVLRFTKSYYNIQVKTAKYDVMVNRFLMSRAQSLLDPFDLRLISFATSQKDFSKLIKERTVDN